MNFEISVPEDRKKSEKKSRSFRNGFDYHLIKALNVCSLYDEPCIHLN